MNPAPAVTVIVPTYHSAGTLKLALESVRRQTFADYEVWIVGDGCRDDSERIVASFGEERFRWLNLEENSGTPSRPRNEGLRRARGRYVAYLGHDDLWFPWHLEDLVEHARRSGCAFVHSLGAIVAPEGIDGFFSLPPGLKLRHGWISPSNWLHELSLVREIGPWSARTRVAVDREFLGRLRARGIKTSHHRQLSVLKFPSDHWRMYSLAGGFPQEEYAAALARDAGSLSRRLLLEFASAAAERSLGLRRRSRFVEPGFNFVRFLLRMYGYHRWPLDRLLYRRYRRRAGLPRRNGRGRP